jgi:alkylated DNA repair dioxygenase AlkB
MIPTYIPNYCESLYTTLEGLDWLSTGAPREEYFMSDQHMEYTYGRGRGERTYSSSEFHPVVKELMERMNVDFSSQYDICFLNYYIEQRKWLGWHADDSVEMDMNHPIAVVSFGSEREIHWKHKDYKGHLPAEQRQILGDGSLFIMPAGFQRDHLHKIPKHNQPCEGRISLTFRHYVEP